MRESWLFKGSAFDTFVLSPAGIFLVAFGAVVLSGCYNEPYTCVDAIPGWTSKNGRTCQDYIDNNWCTSSGGYGSGWGTNGRFSDWANARTGKTAVDACCVCGAHADTTGRGNTAPVPTTTVTTTTRTITMTTTTTVTTSSTTTTTERKNLRSSTEEDSTEANVLLLVLASVGAGLCLVCNWIFLRKFGGARLCCCCKRYRRWRLKQAASKAASKAAAPAMQTGVVPPPSVVAGIPSEADPADVLPRIEFGPAGSADELFEGFSVHPVDAKEEMELVKQLLHVSDPHNLGTGRDVRTSSAYNNLQVQKIWRVIKPEKKAVYDAKKALCKREVQRAKRSVEVLAVETRLDQCAKGLGLDTTVNEKILLHGTKVENIIAILQNGLNERVSGGLFGQGAYLAEDASKIDQYCTPDDFKDSALENLHQMLYTDGEYPDGGEIFYCFAVRVVLGAPIYTKDGHKNLHDESEDVFATSAKRELSAIPRVSPPMPYHSLVAEAKNESGYKVKRHREFITFEGDRTILEYLVSYRRVQTDD